jgi:biotin carboxylase
MSGPEVSVVTLRVDGECHIIQITDKLTTGAPHFVEMGHSQPTQLCSRTAERIKWITQAANRAIGITSGPSHTEIIVTEEGPKIVELGARLGGDCITTHLVPLSTGVDMVECCIRIALGEKPEITPKFKRGSAIRYFEQTAGTVENIDGVDTAERIDGVRQISIVHGVGETVTEITSSGARLGFVIAQADTAEKAVAVCEGALKEITIDIR